MASILMGFSNIRKMFFYSLVKFFITYFADASSATRNIFFLSWSLSYCGDVSKNIDCSCTQLFLTWPCGWGWHSCVSEWHGRLKWAWHCVSESGTCLWVSLTMLCGWSGTAGWAGLERLGGWAWHSWVGEPGTAEWVRLAQLSEWAWHSSVSERVQQCGWPWPSWVGESGTCVWVRLAQLGEWAWNSCVGEPRTAGWMSLA